MDVTLSIRRTLRKTRKGIRIFHEMTADEQEEIIKENPGYGNIICRCETITEGEILDAIHRPLGARSMELLSAGYGREWEDARAASAGQRSLR